MKVVFHPFDIGEIPWSGKLSQVFQSVTELSWEPEFEESLATLDQTRRPRGERVFGGKFYNCRMNAFIVGGVFQYRPTDTLPNMIIGRRFDKILQGGSNRPPCIDSTFRRADPATDSTVFGVDQGIDRSILCTSHRLIPRRRDIIGDVDVVVMPVQIGERRPKRSCWREPGQHGNTNIEHTSRSHQRENSPSETFTIHQGLHCKANEEQKKRQLYENSNVGHGAMKIPPFRFVVMDPALFRPCEALGRNQTELYNPRLGQHGGESADQGERQAGVPQEIDRHGGGWDSR
ncbi:hypothetical protein DFH09DRAFT_1171914 [Mycena vulgaris]|nr:hypothetical protein DFH09DRAFT_1171914 [Mycena vulgaris]